MSFASTNASPQRSGREIDALAVFAVMWAAASVFHLAKWSDWLAAPHELLLATAAVLVFLDPTSLARLSLLGAAQIHETWSLLPDASNHGLFASLLNLGLLGSIALTLAAARFGTVERDRVYATFAAPARISVLLLYAVSVFHKLNVDWFDPETSCGSAMYLQLARRLVVLPQDGWAAAAALHASLYTEAAIPLLLAFARTRAAGLLLAIAFHYALGLAGFFNFSALLYATFVLFVPVECVSSAVSELRGGRFGGSVIDVLEGRDRFRIARRASILVVLGCLGTIALAPWSGFEASEVLVRELRSGQRTAASYVFEAAFWAYGVLFVAIVYHALRDRPRWPSLRAIVASPAPSLLLVPVLVAFNGATPYLGLKSDTAFGMFSNLATAGETTNHLIVRSKLGLGAHQDDLVTIIESSDPELRKVGERSYRIPWLKLRSYVQSARARGAADVFLVYERGGVRHSTRNAESDPALAEPIPLLVHKLAQLRLVRPRGANRCQR